MEKKELVLIILGQVICPLLVELIKIILLKFSNKNKKRVAVTTLFLISAWNTELVLILHF